MLIVANHRFSFFGFFRRIYVSWKHEGYVFLPYLGQSVSTKNEGSIVSFAIEENQALVFERSNERHDFYQQQIERNIIELASFGSSHGRSAFLQAQKKTVKGAKGPCVLRSLSRFDVGRSFVFGSLHNLYLGLFVSEVLVLNAQKIFFVLETAAIIVA